MILGPMLVAHDATPIAWFIVAAYFVGAAMALVAARSAVQRRERLFWIGCSLLLTLLGLNKQLDLQSLITNVGRELAHEEGWFEQRRFVQAAFILAFGGGALVAIVGLFAWLRRSAGTVKLAAIGIVLLFAFVVIRAASFHHMDGWVTTNVGGLRTGWWLELAGIVTIGLSALAYSRGNRARAG